MPISDSPSSATSYPQTGTNRSRSELEIEIGEYVGLGDTPSGRALAGRCLRTAIQRFNDRPWTFNRLTQDIALNTPVAVSGTDNEYDLATDFRNPLRAWLVDANGDARDTVEWVSWAKWSVFAPTQSSKSSSPTRYTARNVHETGRIIVDPSLDTAALKYPTLRIHYHRRIVLPLKDTERLNCPEEVEGAILELAAAIAVHKLRREGVVGSPALEYNLAKASRSAVEDEYGDFPDVQLSRGN